MNVELVNPEGHYTDSPLEKPTNFNDGLLMLFPLIIGVIGFGIREWIAHTREYAKAQCDLEIEKERTENAQQNKLVENLIAERRELLLQLIAANHALECTDCKHLQITNNIQREEVK